LHTECGEENHLAISHSNSPIFKTELSTFSHKLLYTSITKVQRGNEADSEEKLGISMMAKNSLPHQLLTVHQT